MCIRDRVDKIYKKEDNTKVYILSPIVRGRKGEYRKEFIDLRKKGFKVTSLHKKYSINENLMGATISGSEIDEWKEPSSESFVLCKLPHQYPKKSQNPKIPKC